VRLFFREDLNLGLILGTCIMTMPLLMMHLLSESLWLKKSILKLDHSPYSPDLALYNFWLFPKLKTALKGHRFSDIADIQEHAMTILKNIPKEEFQKCFEQWKH
jgi:hypothetical protein